MSIICDHVVSSGDGGGGSRQQDNYMICLCCRSFWLREICQVGKDSVGDTECEGDVRRERERKG